MKAQESWYVDWQDSEHARHLDARSTLPRRSLIRNYESFSDVLLLNKRLKALRDPPVLEVGCATGEFYRYLGLRHPQASYTGVDISRPAVLRAQQKYPEGRFFLSDPVRPLSQTLQALHLTPQWPIVYTKDVLHHQAEPWAFLGQLLEICSDSLIFRTRTREQGATVLDPERSCQYHYQGWMPYVVLNTDELIGEIQRNAPESEILLYRNPVVLGGKENRFLPKECYLPETGTAETAVGVFRRSSDRHRVQRLDRPEVHGRYPLWDRLALLFQKRVRGK